MKSLELKIPPVALVVIFAVAMWLISVAAPAFRFSLPAHHLLVLILTIGGIGVILSGVVSFRRAKTTVNPLRPETASALVDSGIYRFTRNPMYLGFLIVLFGWAMLLANVLSLLMLIGFVSYMNQFQIIPEEKALSARFGSAFTIYSKRVRRWL